MDESTLKFFHIIRDIDTYKNRLTIKYGLMDELNLSDELRKKHIEEIQSQQTIIIDFIKELKKEIKEEIIQEIKTKQNENKKNFNL